MEACVLAANVVKDLLAHREVLVQGFNELDLRYEQMCEQLEEGGSDYRKLEAAFVDLKEAKNKAESDACTAAARADVAEGKGRDAERRYAALESLSRAEKDALHSKVLLHQERAEECGRQLAKSLAAQSLLAQQTQKDSETNVSGGLAASPNLSFDEKTDTPTATGDNKVVDQDAELAKPSRSRSGLSQRDAVINRQAMYIAQKEAELELAAQGAEIAKAEIARQDAEISSKGEYLAKKDERVSEMVKLASQGAELAKAEIARRDAKIANKDGELESLQQQYRKLEDKLASVTQQADCSRLLQLELVSVRAECDDLMSERDKYQYARAQQQPKTEAGSTSVQADMNRRGNDSGVNLCDQSIMGDVKDFEEALIQERKKSDVLTRRIHELEAFISDLIVQQQQQQQSQRVTLNSAGSSSTGTSKVAEQLQFEKILTAQLQEQVIKPTLSSPSGLIR
jgi:hypothetical protein